jgi:hypothetical protein
MKRFGKKRVPDCECLYNFTCRRCLVSSLQEGLPQKPPVTYTKAQNDLSREIIDKILAERK